jgi:carbamoyltransferase
MKILGIHTGHDAGAALLDNGRVISAINEERLNRKKMFWGVPILSIAKVIEETGIKPGEIDVVALSGLTKGGGAMSDFRSVSAIKRAADFASYLPFMRSKLVKEVYLSIFKNFRDETDLSKMLKDIGVTAPVKNIEHHECHAAGAYYTSQFTKKDEADVLVVTTDSSGDGLCSTISEINNGKIKRLNETVFFHSPCAPYSYVTHNLGFKYLRHEGKITGLAAYGEAQKTLGIFLGFMGLDRERLEFRSRLGCWGRPGARKLHMLLQGYKREDIAAGVQKAVEKVASELIGAACKRYGKKFVCLSGGLYANVRVNQVILEESGIEDIFIHQHMGDGGQALGAAYAVWAEAETQPVPQTLQNAYLGPDFSDEQIKAALENKKIKYEYCDSIHERIAKLLVDGKIIARFHGAMEYGPRALGNRSIMYQTSDKTINDWLNKRLRRTEFMPFAPIILAERAGEYFKNFDLPRAHAARFMTITCNVTDKCKADSPAITHIDGTARPQIVEQENNPDTYGILKAYEALTGKPILINTSFNMHEEPIVCTPHEAMDSFLESKLDVLAIGKYLCEYQLNL